MLALIFSLCTLHAADLAPDLNALLAQKPDPGPYTHELQTKSMEFPVELPGRLYGAVAWKTIEQPIAKVRAYFAQPGAIFRALGAVKTQRDLEKISETPSELELKLAIKVPVVSDYRTQDVVRFEGDRMSWRQSAPDGQLEDNAGYVEFAADGESACRVLVVGVHVIKPEHRVPWLGRATASRFARQHYAGYVEALEVVLH